MKLRGLLAIITITVIALTFVAVTAILSQTTLNPKSSAQSTSNTKVTTNNTTQTVELTEETPHKTSYKFKHVVGWIPTFDYTNAKNSYYANITKFTDISPVYYDLKPDGTVTARSQTGDKELITKSKANNVKVIPTILSFSENDLQKAVASEDSIKTHNNYILAEVEKYNYDGIDIDYESINRTDKEGYFKLLQGLYSSLKSKNKILSITVVPKDKDSGYTSLIETREVQDWSELGKICDQLRIMAYDYSAEDTPGPVSPTDWVRSVANYGQKRLGSNDYKLVIGQPYYAYAYGNNKRYAYVFSEINQIIKDQKLTGSLDPETNEKILTFKKGDEERKMWYQDSETFSERFYILDNLEVAGVAFWRLGGEDPNIYKLIDNK